MKTRICKKCGEEKPLGDFAKFKKCKDGRGYRCKICQNKRVREKYANDPEYREQYRERENRQRREQRANDPEYHERINRQRRERRANNPEYRERINRQQLKRLADNPEYRERINRQKRERCANDSEYREHKNEKAKENVEKLKPHYIRQIIKIKYKIPRELIDDDMIKRERELIKINRLFRRQSNDGTKKIN